MSTILGLFGILAWIVAVIAIAAAVTYVVVRLSPGDKPSEPDYTPESQV
jgi:hypothetical protein